MDSNSEDAIDRLRRIGMHPKDRPQHRSLVRASVLVSLFSRNTGTTENVDDKCLHVLLTKRPEKLRTHPGEVCFPGGKQDAEDNHDDVETALREAHEEVGLDRRHVQPLCRLETVESYTGLCVTPIVAFIDPATSAEPSQLKLSEDEVEFAFAVPLSYFANDDNLTSKYDVDWRGGTFEMRTYHYMSKEECNNGKTFQIWGLTAYIAHQVAVSTMNNSQSERLTTPNVTVAPPSETQPVAIAGYLFRLEDGTGIKPHWIRRYFVLDGPVLHQYDNETQARHKDLSATKKNRLSLSADVSVDELPLSSPSQSQDEGKHDFAVSILRGRIQWHLAASTLDGRNEWMEALRQYNSER